MEIYEDMDHLCHISKKKKDLNESCDYNQKITELKSKLDGKLNELIELFYFFSDKLYNERRNKHEDEFDYEAIMILLKLKKECKKLIEENKDFIEKCDEFLANKVK